MAVVHLRDDATGASFDVLLNTPPHELTESAPRSGKNTPPVALQGPASGARRHTTIRLVTKNSLCGWDGLPALPLRRVLQFLRPADVASVACACRSWLSAACVPGVWSAAVVADPVLAPFSSPRAAMLALRPLRRIREPPKACPPDDIDDVLDLTAAGPAVDRVSTPKWTSFGDFGVRGLALGMAHKDAALRALWRAHQGCMVRTASLIDRARGVRRLAHSLNPPCDPAQLVVAEKVLGTTLPLELRGLWLHADGQPRGLRAGCGLFGTAGRMFSVHECVQEVRALHEACGALPERPRHGTSESPAPSDGEAWRMECHGQAMAHHFVSDPILPMRNGRWLVPLSPKQGFTRAMLDVVTGEAVLVTSLQCTVIAPTLCTLIEDAVGAFG